MGIPAISHPPRILMLYGSVRERSYSRLATEEAGRLLTAMGADVRIFNPSGLPLPDDAPESHPKVMELRELVRWSEGMVWCSPERHGAMTGIMKAQIDWIPLSEGAVRRTQARAGPAPGDQPEQRPVPGRAFAAAGRAVGHRHPPGQGQRAARCHPHRVRAENHPAGCGGAGSGAGADRPNQPVTAAHQDHRTADGRGRLDGLQPPLHPLEGRGRGQRQDVAAVRNPR